MPSYRSGPHSKFDLKVHLVWIPKYRKAVLVGPVALRVRNLLREIAMERELTMSPARWHATMSTCRSPTVRIRA